MKKIYCPNCGKENDINNKKCSECQTKLKQKDYELLKYLAGKGTDTVFDKGIDLVKDIIKKHCYGIILSISVIFSSGVIINNVINNPQNDYEKVDSKQEFQSMSEEEILYGCWIDEDNHMTYHFINPVSVKITGAEDNNTDFWYVYINKDGEYLPRSNLLIYHVGEDLYARGQALISHIIDNIESNDINSSSYFTNPLNYDEYESKQVHLKRVSCEDLDI